MSSSSSTPASRPASGTRPPRRPWPVLPAFEAWQDTHDTLHRWTQIAGKIRLERSPWINHSWGSTLYLSPRGLTTGLIPDGDRSFALDFDFVDHAFRMRTTDGVDHGFALEPMSVATFHARTMDALRALGIEVEILARPVEVEKATPFAQDEEHRSYDPAPVRAFWEAMIRVEPVFQAHRARFRGKGSPVHFFWGAFDLAVTRFSGRTAPRHPGGAPNCADWVMAEAYSHELASAGFWAGAGLGEAAFYAYAYPEPEGYREAPVGPEGAHYHTGLREFVLPWDAVRSSPDPAAALARFLDTTASAAATLGGWNRDDLEWDPEAEIQAMAREEAAG